MVRTHYWWREWPRIRLRVQDREIVAAWFVVLLTVVAGLSFFNIQQYAASHCPTTPAMPRVLHRPLAVAENWEDPACSSGLCNYMLLAHEIDDESEDAAEPADDPVAAYSGKHHLPLDTIENTGNERSELHCS